MFICWHIDTQIKARYLKMHIDIDSDSSRVQGPESGNSSKMQGVSEKILGQV